MEMTTNEYKNILDMWKADYKDLSQRIREMKASRKQYIWKGRKPRVKAGDNPNYNSSAQWEVEILREKACSMMAKRKELKYQAQEYAKMNIVIYS